MDFDEFVPELDFSYEEEEDDIADDFDEDSDMDYGMFGVAPDDDDESDVEHFDDPDQINGVFRTTFHNPNVLEVPEEPLQRTITDSVRFEKLFSSIRSQASRDSLSLDDSSNDSKAKELPPTDITLVVGPEKVTIRAHKLVLWTRSPFFAALFTSKFSDADSEEIRLPLDTLGSAHDSTPQVKRYLPSKEELSAETAEEKKSDGVADPDTVACESPLMRSFWDILRYCYGLPVAVTEGNCLALREMSGFFQIDQIYSHACDLITLITESMCDRRTRVDHEDDAKRNNWNSVWSFARVNWIQALHRYHALQDVIHLFAPFVSTHIFEMTEKQRCSTDYPLLGMEEYPAFLVTALIRSDCFLVPEMSLFRAVITWLERHLGYLQTKKKKRQSLAFEILSGVRFHLIKRADVDKVLMATCKPVRDICAEFFKSARGATAAGAASQLPSRAPCKYHVQMDIESWKRRMSDIPRLRSESSRQALDFYNYHATSSRPLYYTWDGNIENDRPVYRACLNRYSLKFHRNHWRIIEEYHFPEHGHKVVRHRILATSLTDGGESRPPPAAEWTFDALMVNADQEAIREVRLLISEEQK